MILNFTLKKIFFGFKKLIREYNLYKYSKKHRCNFGEGINFLGPLKNIEIGKNTTINSNANFRFTDAKIKIGHSCLIARNVTILTKSYHLDKEKISTDDMFAKEVIIGNNVLLGGNIIIMPGVKIGNGSVIGAGSIVTKNVGDLEIWAGVPAKLIRKRLKSEK